jgi:hypothetical protein
MLRTAHLSRNPAVSPILEWSPSSNTVVTILTRLVCPMALDVVIMHPGSVDSEHFFPARCPREFLVSHFSDGIEVTFDVILPCLP